MVRPTKQVWACIEDLYSGAELRKATKPKPGRGKDKAFVEVAYVLHEFNLGIAQHPDLESPLLPVGDGVTVSVKRL